MIPNGAGADYSSVLVTGSMLVLVEDAAEPVPSADLEVRDLLRVGYRFGERAQGCGSPEGPVEPAPVPLG